MASVGQRRLVAAYRDIHRAINEVFVGNVEGIQKCRQALRTEFRTRTATTEAERLENANLAEDAAMFLRTSIIQAKLGEHGRYEMKLDNAVSPDGDDMLRLHDAGTACAGLSAKSPAGVIEGCGSNCSCK